MEAKGPISLSSDVDHWLTANAAADVKSERREDWRVAYEVAATAEKIKQFGFKKVRYVAAAWRDLAENENRFDVRIALRSDMFKSDQSAILCSADRPPISGPFAGRCGHRR
jgi:hypothetical protein